MSDTTGKQVPPGMQAILAAGQAMAQGFFDALARQHVAMQDSSGVAAQKLPMPETEVMASLQKVFAEKHAELWSSMLARTPGAAGPAVVQPEPGDKRFAAPEWSESPVFDYMRQAYLLNAGFLRQMADAMPIADGRAKARMQFLTRQYIDALSPSNFAATNPEFIKTAVETKGESIARGIQNLLGDLEKGRISMTDDAAFEIGRNLALTPGSVVYENELMQLIQYTPSTKQVARRPLLIVPPWINKFYILDLQPKNSFIKYCVDQGQTVFVVSWVNPDERHRDMGWDAYMTLGPLAALDAIEQATGESEVNAIGYCIGGTLLATVLGWMAAADDRRIASATFFTCIMDFEDAGELTLFVDEEQLAKIERQMDEKGYLDAGAMASTFNLMRANDLIWSFVVGNYLLGKEAMPFDLLYWNSDSTRMPAATHRYYLRNMYQKNLLKEPGGLVLKGTPIDLRQVTVPVFLLSAREDHIAPWRNTYAAAGLYGGPVRFVLAGSGHIAGVINPANSTKYGFWTNDALPPEAETWLEQAEQHAGSWWPTWSEWIGQYAGGKVKARVPGEGKLPALEAAPGSYVKIES